MARRGSRCPRSIASGRLPDGTTFDGLPELRDVLLERHVEFVATVTERLMTYALGRGIASTTDRPALRAIVREAEAGRLSVVVADSRGRAGASRSR